MFQILYSARAREQLGRMREVAQKSPASAEAAEYRRIVALIRDVLPEARLALGKENALAKRGSRDFRKIFREKAGQRGRLFYIASTRLEQLIVLMIGYRKEGDAHDAYEELSRVLKSGEFDACFRQLDVPRPLG